MAQPFSFMLHVPESGEDASLCDERAVQDSFHQLLQEQCVAEQQLELQELTLGGRENLACSAAAVGQAEACEEPKPRGQHPDFSAATLQILASMPSRTIGRSRGAVISQCYNRTVRLRRQSSQSPLHLLPRSARPSLRQYDLELDSGLAEQDETRSLLVKELQGLTSSQRNHMLQAMPVSLAEKRSIRQELGGQRSTLRKPTRSRRPLSCCGQRRHNCSTVLWRLWEGPLSLQPWHHSLKQIGGRFGSSVLSYFLFLKTLLAFNLFLSLSLLLFVVAVQAAYPPGTEGSRLVTGLEPLSGAGYFTQTLMYYGYYSNFTLNDPCGPSAGSKKCQSAKGHLPYNMPLAYVFTIGVSFFVTCILLVYSMSRSFGESYRVDCMSGHFASKVFCAWDYKELLAEWQTKSCPMSLCRRLGRMLVFSLAWALSLGTVLGCAMAVYFFSKHMRTVHQDSRDRGSSEAQQEAILLALPVVVSLLNLVMPYLYNLLAAWEKQESPVLEVYVAICRNLILKMIILGLLCYHWLSWEIQYELETQCWETAVGQELYRLVVMDFLFTLLDSFLGELLWRLILEKKLGSKRRPEFDIARNVLELIYGQTLTWLGVLFCPLLPAVQILKLVLLFYIKKTSLLKNCQSPSKPWRASHMSTVFITLLCFPSFLGAAIFLSYTIWAVRPSKKCGPFQMQETIYESGMAWIRELEKSSPNITWFTWIHQHLVENTFLLFFVSGVLLAVIYLHIQVVKGQQRIIRLLKEQITNEGEDKAFLIERLQGIYGKRERRI
ncbi:transmembrane channel-like protein 6 isoform X2 [Carettochelys insculpta]|uniref:transmembrane channel-like protein 6 isoform X2 n=1 Tax=Carettochelys insculpta TaxID=44489 RepID=UPI003EBDB2B0